MIELDNVTKAFSRTWGSVSNGWNHLVHRASNALTRFDGKEDDQNESVGMTRWGLISADIFDDDDCVVVNLETPGMQEGDFDIRVVENVLYVKGEKHFERETSKGGYTVKERAYGHFERVLPLGYEVNAEKAKASYKQGVLRIVVHKSEHHKRRKIQVH